MPRQALLPPVLDHRFIERGPGSIGWEVVPDMAVEVGAAAGPIQFAEPAALVAIAAWAERLFRRGGTITILDSAKSKYAWNVGLLRALSRRTPFHTDVQHKSSWFPLCRADDGLKLATLGSNLGVFLNIPGESARAALAYTVSEMVRNAAEHSETKGSVFFAGSWFRTAGRATFAVADAGIGVKGSLIKGRVLDTGQSDADAIDRAIQPHVTGAGRGETLWAPNNAGLGLYVTRKIVQACDGDFFIQSFGAGFRERRGQGRYSGTLSPWEGTLVEVTIRPAGMPEFSPLFDEIVATDADGGSAVRLHFTSGPREALVVKPPVDETGFAADKEWFIEHRQECLEELEAGGLVEVSFEKAKYTTQSAIHALIYEPIRRLGPTVLERLWFAGAARQIRAVLRQVVGYAVARSPDAD